MKQKGFIPIVLILILAMASVVVYFFVRFKIDEFKSNQKINNSSTTNSISNIIIPDVIDQWAPQVNWQKTTTGNYQVGWMEKPMYGTERKGTILISDPNPYDIFSLIESNVTSNGWKIELGQGASGPMERIEMFSRTKNNLNKVLVVDVLMLDDISKNLPNYKNEITIFQEL